MGNNTPCSCDNPDLAQKNVPILHRTENPEDENGKKKKFDPRQQPGKKFANDHHPKERGISNILITALSSEFLDSLRAHFKSRKDSFNNLGGRADGFIDKEELNAFLKTIGHTNKNLNEQLFRLIDTTQDGFISQSEFKAFFDEETEELTEFKGLIDARFDSYKHAFDRVGGGDDDMIDETEFVAFCDKYFPSYPEDKRRALFKRIDVDKDGTISKAEFKAVFDAEGQDAAIIDFKQLLNDQFKSRKNAFDQMGGADDDEISKEEFLQFLEDMHYGDKEANERIFDMIDEDRNGSVSGSEFKAFFKGGSAKVLEFQDILRKKFKTPKDAFKHFGGDDDGKIDKMEFFKYMKESLGYEDVTLVQQLYSLIDDNDDGFILLSEFKIFALHGGDLEAHAAAVEEKKKKPKKKRAEGLKDLKHNSNA